MLSSCHVFPDKRLVLARFSGVYTTADGKEMAQRLLDAPPSAMSYSHLYDLSEVQTFDADFGNISSMISWKASRFSAIPPGTACAFFAPGDIAFGMARMYQMVAEGVLPLETTVTRSEREALAFAGQEATTISELLRTEDAG